MDRTANLQRMADTVLDLLVIGGGITGAGIAWDASLRGMHVGVLEKNDFASGTSSRSTKLIHGGLRYLKQGEIILVREVGRERALLHSKVPHLVIPTPMLLPIFQGGTYGFWATSIGLYIYDLLAGVKRGERRTMLNREETIRMEPLIKTDGLKGAGYYYEYRTDDARLTIEILKTAVENGALIGNYAKVTGFVYEDGKCTGVKAEDQLTQKVFIIRAKKIVNAAGPWVDQVRKRDGVLNGKRLFLTKGVHLVFHHDRLPVRHAAYFDVPDGRMIFVIPRGDVTYVGTTDTAYSGCVDEPRTTIADRDYLISAVNQMFPSVNLTPEDVVSTWAGLRPLIYEDGKKPSELSRKDEIFLSRSGLITIAGGKLTGFRKMAEKVVNLVAAQLKNDEGIVFPDCSTVQAPISGGYLEGYEYEQWKQIVALEGKQRGIDDAAVSELLSLYGANVLKIYQLFDSIYDYDSKIRLLRAQILYSIQSEMTVTAVDYLVRRTGLLYFDRIRTEETARRVVEIMGDVLGWDVQEKQAQLAAVEAEIAVVKHLPATETARVP